MSNYPNHNSNDLHHVLKNNVRNRVITDRFESGSTVKPLVIMVALKASVINVDSIINTEPFYITPRYKVQDITLYNNTLTIKGILQKSSNVGVSRIALKIPFLYLIDTYIKYNMG